MVAVGCVEETAVGRFVDEHRHCSVVHKDLTDMMSAIALMHADLNYMHVREEMWNSL